VSAQGPGEDRSEIPRDEPPPDDAPPSPDVVAALGELLRTSGAAWTAGRESLSALRILLQADISLARSAFGRTLALTGVAIAAGASAWLMLMAALIVFLSNKVGLPWTVSLLICGVATGAIAAWAGWRAQKYFEDTRLRASRRQLARLGIGELADMSPPAGSAESSENAAKWMSETSKDTPIKKDLGVDITPP
jgi:hypothetical protein